jgi:hypothetical protein
MTRRDFFATSALAMAQTSPKRIAIIATVYKYLTHAQHIGDRFIIGYPIDGAWHKPPVEVVSLYVDQGPSIRTIPTYPTIAQALRRGGAKLAVDAVLIIAEHGDYPDNDKGQKLYPRFEFFEQVAKVFEEDGRSVPVYNDKALSYSFEKALKMRDTSRRLKFPMLAGSSLPVTWRLPDVELPLNCEIEDVLMVGNGGSDAMDYHALEAMQCMVERRRGGETGVKNVQLIEGDAVWSDKRWSKAMLTSALSRSDTPQGLTVTDGRTQDLVASNELPKLVKNPAAYFIEYRDGLKATMMMLNGALTDFNIAVKLKGKADIVSTQFFLSPVPNVTYSARLVSGIEKMIVSGVAPYPVERTLLVSGMLESCLTSRVKGHKKLDTPQLDVRYRRG